jgi:MFS family permease
MGMNGRSRPGSFLLVSLCYQGFTLSDGALRMLVLLHLHAEGRTAWALALVLLPYELAGAFTNLLGGWLGARFGTRLPLLLGLSLQVVGCLMLAADAAWLSIPYVMATQVMSGVAKDLTKTAAKGYVRFLAPTAADGEAGLFRQVAWLTGSKNVTKGLGFFVGGALLAWFGFRWTNLGLAALLVLLALGAAASLPRFSGKRNVRLAAVVDHGTAVRWLAAARAFLFASRDVWFTLAVPLFLAQSLDWPSPWVGGFLSAWVIGYGIVQACAPRLLRWRDATAAARGAVWLIASLALPLLSTAAALRAELAPGPTVVVGLAGYGALFALCSSVHSWLVLAIADGDSTVERVGFYYAANSVGRVGGLLLSGALFAGGVHDLFTCLVASTVLVGLAVLCSLAVRTPRA